MQLMANIQDIGLAAILVACSVGCASDSPARDTVVYESGTQADGSRDGAVDGATDADGPAAFGLNSIAAFRQTSSSDSHAGETFASTIESNYRERRVHASDDLAKFFYPRLRKLRDGSYLLLYQEGPLAKDVFYMKSSDGLTWDGATRQLLFESYIAPRHSDGVEESKRFSSADFLELRNGDILAFASYRFNSGYTLAAVNCGIEMRRSKDGGLSWESPQTVYVGRNWEPFALQLDSGEVHLYFSATAVKFYQDPTVADENTGTSSGVALITSVDDGATWSPDVTVADYPNDLPNGGAAGAPPLQRAKIVMQQQVATTQSGTLQFTDQMPTAVELNTGKIILMTESEVTGETRFRLSLSSTLDNWATGLGIDESGPTSKIVSWSYGAGPYLLQFESGETVLSYNTNNQFYLRVANENGRNYQAPIEAFRETAQNEGYWGTIAKDTEHALIAVMPNVNKLDSINYDNRLMVDRYYLNHTVEAAKRTVTVDGRTNDWSLDADALFVGSDSQAQMSVRFACAETSLFAVFERLDREVTSDDTVTLSYVVGEDPVVHMLEFGVDVALNQHSIDGASVSTDTVEVTRVLVDESMASDKDREGVLYELRLPLAPTALRSASYIRVNLALVNSDDLGTLTTDTLENVDADHTRWIKVDYTSCL